MSVAELSRVDRAPTGAQGSDGNEMELTFDLKYVFRSSAYAFGLRNVEAEIRGGLVALGGQVSSYYLKQVAQHLAKSEFSDCELVNGIKVKDRPQDWTRR